MYGETLTIGDWDNGDNDNMSGHIRAYHMKDNGKNWKQLGHDFDDRDTIRLIGDDIPMRHTYYLFTAFGHNLNGHTTEVFMNERHTCVSKKPGQHVEYRVLIATDLRRLGTNLTAE